MVHKLYQKTLFLNAVNGICLRMFQKRSLPTLKTNLHRPRELTISQLLNNLFLLSLQKNVDMLWRLTQNPPSYSLFLSELFEFDKLGIICLKGRTCSLFIVAFSAIFKPRFCFSVYDSRRVCSSAIF